MDFSSHRNTSSDRLSEPDVWRRHILKTGIASSLLPVLGGPAFASAPVQAPVPSALKPVLPYQVKWTAEQLDALRAAIRSFRLPRTVPGSNWTYGMDAEYLQQLMAYWADGFSMEGAASTLNRYPQYTTRVEDIDIHFIRVIGEGGPHKARLPLLCTHGWPGSTFEFWDVIEPLAFPARHGAKGDVAFDLIIPSLPGFGPSGKPVRPIGARTTARLWDKLMRENLGYAAYYAQGGDWGAGVTGWLALDHPQAVRAIHLNLMIAGPQVPARTAEERQFHADAEEHERRWGAYYQLQATEPQSLAFAMAGNPVAQAAWLIQRFYTWSDRRTRPFAQVFSMDQLLTNVMVYVMNDAFQTSTWFYAGSHEEHVKQMPKGVRVGVPTGFASYAGDARSPTPPRSIVEQGYNLRYWTDMPQGGHFAAMEVPQAFVKDIRAWARALKL